MVHEAICIQYEIRHCIVAVILAELGLLLSVSKDYAFVFFISLVTLFRSDVY